MIGRDKFAMSLKAEFINPSLESIIWVLKTMAFLEPIPGYPFIKNGSSSTGDVSGIEGITGKEEAISRRAK
jgi:chemotaxis protein CheX